MLNQANEHDHWHKGTNGQVELLDYPAGDADLEFLMAAAARNNWPNTWKSIGLAVDLHDGQHRERGEPYVSHPLAVARLLLAHGIVDDALLASALLHDVLEDCSDRVTASDLLTIHGLDARVVSAVITLTRAPADPKNEYFARIATSGDAILVKIADRCHNVQTMAGVFAQEKIQRKFTETRKYVLPLREQGLSLSPEHAAPLRALCSRMESTLTQIAVD
jgi:(p)ppGpp synthase/HD superfamily hydrolase